MSGNDRHRRWPRLGESLVALRSVLYASGFVLLWGWLAASVRPLDQRVPFALPTWLRPAGYAIAAAGILVDGLCILSFITTGRGTPAPFDPPRAFVASGPYRYVRNPMYLGGAAVILGAGLAMASPSIVLLAVGFLVMAHLLVVFYEEPALASRFGESYARYRSNVHRWLIRISRRAGTRSDASPCILFLSAISSLSFLSSNCAPSPTRPRFCPPYTATGSLDISPTYSPDARHIAYAHGLRNASDTTGIYIIAANGGTPTRLTDTLFPTDPELSWSPDGERIAFYLGAIWTVTVVDGILHRWTFNGPSAVHPTWSPDGRYIAYVVNAHEYGQPDSATGLHLIDTRDGTQRALLHDAMSTSCEGISWSPVAPTLALAAYGTGRATTDIYTMSLDGTQYHRLTAMDGTASNPQWNNDGSVILFDFTPSPCLPELSNNRTTWRVNRDGTGLRKWPVNLGDPRVTFAFPFALSPANQRVAFVGLDGTKHVGVIWTKALDGSDPHQITQP